MRTCSITFAPDGRKTGYSLASGRIMRARVPVVFAHVVMPPARKPPAMSRVTLDFPLVPFTWMRIGIFEGLLPVQQGFNKAQQLRGRQK